MVGDLVPSAGALLLMAILIAAAGGVVGAVLVWIF